MAVSGRNKPRTSGKRKGEAGLVDKILLDLGITALSFLPAGAVIRGGQLIYKGLKGARAMAAARKALDASKKASKTEPATKVREAVTKPKTQTKPATTAKKPQDKPKEQPKKLTQQPKKIPKKKPGTAVTVTKPTPKPKRTAQPKTKEMKKANVVSSTTRTPKKVTGPAKPAPKPKKTLTKKQKAAIAAAVITGGAAVTKIATTKKKRIICNFEPFKGSFGQIRQNPKLKKIVPPLKLFAYGIIFPQNEPIFNIFHFYDVNFT